MARSFAWSVSLTNHYSLQLSFAKQRHHLTRGIDNRSDINASSLLRPLRLLG